MKRTRMFIAAVATALAGATSLFAGAAVAGGNVGWNVSIGGPGFVVNAGQPAYGWGAPYRPYYKPYYRPAPVVYRPYYPPTRVYVPRPIAYAPPVVVAPRPYYPPYRMGPAPYSPY